MWVDGVRQGRGTELWADGRRWLLLFLMTTGTGQLLRQALLLLFRYEGDWHDDVQHGEGTTTTAAGESYRGSWVEGDFDGHGVYVYSDGSKYEGNWRAGVRYGPGKFVWPNQEEYTGAWVAHKRNGRGKYEWPDGRRFVLGRCS